MIYLYSRDIDGNYTIQDGIVGVSTSITSFYCSEEDKWMGVINPKDYSGDEFLSKIMTGEISLIKYMYNALPQGLYDFKYSNGSVDVSDDKDNNSYYYRGMPVAVNRDGLLMYSSARDVGNIAAGFIGGSCGISWGACRLAFDLLESCQRGRLVVEGVSTQNAEEFGWNLGVLRKTRK